MADVDEAAALRALSRLRERRAESERERGRIAEELLRLVEELAADVDGAVPEALLRGRYLAALLRRIEQGDTSPELLDRFERLAGFRDD